ncbi:DUF4401 domain-containing protein [Propionivibrio sp.]|uniref:DUF4401 domain-containing protein n=1 Tax=Propionivibrio sp. TaxID=2212460 RepID=UPI003BF2E398
MLESLLNELRAEGHLRGEISPSVPEEAGVSHWIVALQVIGGWLAAIFMLLFLGMGAAPLIKGASSWVVVGLIMTALTGLLIGRVVPSGQSGSMVLRQFLLVASLAGHGALIVGASLFGKDEEGTSFFMIAIYESVLLLWVAWMPHRLVAALVGAGALVAAVDLTFSLELARNWLGIYWLVACLLWHQEPRWQAQRYAEAVHALASALTLLCFAYALSGFFAGNFLGFHKGFRFDAALVCTVSIAFVLILARPLVNSVRNLLAVVLLVAALGVTWQAPAVGMGALALVFGFARGHRWLMWLGGALLVFGVGRYYYDLQMILLHKSALMVLGGLLLLTVRALIVGQEDRA